MRRLSVIVLGLLAPAAALLAWVTFRAAPEPAEDDAGPGWFVDVTDQAGLDFVHDAGPPGAYFMPQIMGSGAAVLDFDGDGRPDLYLLSNAGPGSASTNRLYRNLGGGQFADVTTGSGLGIAGYNMGVAIGDVNNDGLPDVLVTQYGGIKLFLNQGGGKFADVTEAAGLHNPAWGTSAAFVDYDRDGWLDLVVVNYVDYDPSRACRLPNGAQEYCRPSVFPGMVTRLFRNRGPQPGGGGVRFDDVTLDAGLGRVPGPGLGVLCADIDGDGWPDIFVANDLQPNRLWINQHDGTFKEEAALRGVAYSGMGLAMAGMGIAYGDVDGDGLMDIFVTHFRGETHTLWKQGPRGLFLDGTAAAGLARPRWQGTGFGTVLIDLDLDGHGDLVVVNGHVSRSDAAPEAGRDPRWGWYADRNQIFANDGRGHFTDVSPAHPGFCRLPNVGRGLVWLDFDGDGKPDLLVTSVADRARLYRNVAPAAGHWLVVRARLPSPADPTDPTRDRDALGAEVEVTARGGERRWQQLVGGGQSYLCSSEPSAPFGLGPVDRVDSIRVRWPDGLHERFAGTTADRVVVLRRGAGDATP